MKTKPLASVVIPSWNNRELLGTCLDSLAKQTYKNIEIIVVENGSVDGSAEFVRENYPHVVLLPQAKNLGFAGGVNVGIKAAKGKHVALLNNDAIADTEWLGHLVERIESDDKIGIVTSKILKLDQSKKEVTFDSTGDMYYIYGRPSPRGRDVVDTGQYNTAEEVFAASGGASLYRADLFNDIGYFDEDFFAYYEDVDTSFRARLAGWTIWFEPKAEVRHLIGATSGGGASSFSRYHSVKNQWYLYLKNMPASLFWKYLPRFYFLQILFFGNAFLTGLAWPHFRSMMTGAFKTPLMLIKRRNIQKHRKVTAAEIDHWLIKDIPPGVGPNFVRYFGWLIKKK